MRQLLTFIAALSVTVALTSPAARAERVAVDPPMKLLTYRTDRSQVAGEVTAYDDAGFELKTAKGETQSVAWDELAAASVLQVHERLWATTGTAEQWVGLGERLMGFPNGRPHADRALAKALRLDPKLKDRVDAAKRAAAPPGDGPNKSATTTEARPDVEPARQRAGRDRDRDRPAANDRNPSRVRDENDAPTAPPRMIGEPEGRQWRPLSDAEHAEAIEQLKRIAERARRDVTPKLALYETKYFLFYSDLRQSEAEKWAGLLDRMYARLAELFAIPEGQNLWRGKALVFVFNRKEDFLAYERDVQETDASELAGVCHQYGDGQVRIAFFRQPQDLAFAHVLVHESVHGFLHRYRSPQRIPLWANEGLAEVIASELVENRGRRQAVEQKAREYVRSERGLGPGFFGNGRLEAEQYTVAQTLSEFLIRQSKSGYVAFINAIKDGERWEQAMSERYGAPIDRVVAAYGESLGIRGLTRETRDRDDGRDDRD